MYSACIGHRKTTFEQSNLKKFGRRVWSNVHVWASHMCDNDYDWGRMRTQRTHVKVTSSSGNFMPVHECVATCNGVVLIELRQYSIKTTLFYTGLSVNAPAVVQAACAYRYFVYKPRFWRQSNHSGGGGHGRLCCRLLAQNSSQSITSPIVGRLHESTHCIWSLGRPPIATEDYHRAFNRDIVTRTLTGLLAIRPPRARAAANDADHLMR